MTRVLGWLLLLGMVAVAAVWIGQHPGYVTVDWLGYRIQAAVGLLLGLLVAAGLLLLVLLGFLRYLWHLPERFRRRKEESREHRGLDAVTGAIVALATGDADEAAKFTKKARKKFGDVPVVHLLEAQIAYGKGQRESTLAHLKKLQSHEQTRFVATKALARISRQEGRKDAAIKYTREALELNPSDKVMFHALLDLYLQDGCWQEAEHLVRHTRRRRHISPEEQAHYLAMLFHAQSVDAGQRREKAAAMHAAATAHRHDASFIPATLHYVSLLQEEGSKRRATHVIERSWKIAPHPDLAQAMLNLYRDEPPARLIKRAQKLAAKSSQQVEGQLAIAAFAIHARQWETARNHLKAALALQEQRRACKMMAAIEQQQAHNDQAAASWHARAAEAYPGPAWLCGECGHKQRAWSMHCEHCGAFDGVGWQTPREFSEVAASSLLAGM